MATLFINAAFREGSRTLKLAESYLAGNNREVKRIELGDEYPQPLTRASLEVYNQSVSKRDFRDSMFDAARQFVEADEIVIAAPFWNYSIPAVLYAYLEMVCSQGVSFDMDEKGNYYSLCKARRLTYITTAGGPIPENDHAFGYIRDLCTVFWKIDDVRYYKAECLDVYGADVEGILSRVIEQMV